MRSTGWQPLEHELGVSRSVGNVHYPEFSLLITLVRPWITGTPTAWEAHLTEVTTGLEMSRTGFVHRRDAEMWSWYRAVACWPLLVQYRDLLHEQFKANLSHDGKQADQRALIIARIEKVALRDSKRDQDDAAFWSDVEHNLALDLGPDDPDPDAA